MDKYEYKVQKVVANNPTDASIRLSALGEQGWDMKFGTVSGNTIVLILQRPLDAVRAGYKKAEAKKKAAQERMAKAREAKKAKADAKKSKGA